MSDEEARKLEERIAALDPNDTADCALIKLIEVGDQFFDLLARMEAKAAEYAAKEVR